MHSTNIPKTVPRVKAHNDVTITCSRIFIFTTCEFFSCPSADRSYRCTTRYTPSLKGPVFIHEKINKSPANYNAVLSYIPLMQDFLYNVYFRITPRFTSRWMRSRNAVLTARTLNHNSCLYLKSTSTRDTSRKHAPISCGKYTDYQLL